MMERARREHIVNYIHENENDAGKLWRAFNSVLHRAPTRSMPTTIDFATVFPHFLYGIQFCDPRHSVPHITPLEINFRMTSFEPASADEVKKLFLSS